MEETKHSDSSTPSAKELFAWIQQWPGITKQLEGFITKLKRKQIRGSYAVAKLTAELMRNTVGTGRTTTVIKMMGYLRAIGRVLLAAQPLELAMGNIVRRVLFIIRDEYAHMLKSQPVLARRTSATVPPSLQSIMDPSILSDFSASFGPIRQPVIERINELLAELETLSSAISDMALEHIHADEIILTFGHSKTVVSFLNAAKDKGRKFKVVVAESAPSYLGQDTGLELARAGIDATVISDSAIFAMMARVNKVIIGTHVVLANGGLIAPSGTHMVALAAKHHCVPVVCLTGLYKLSPQFPTGDDTVNDMLSPAAVLGFEDSECMGKVEVENPGFDYIPPELVSLYLTDIGGAQSSYVYRLLSENYSREDYVL